MTYRLSSLAWCALFVAFVTATLLGCSDPTDTACGRLEDILDDHGDITSPEEALALADELWQLADGAGDLQADLRHLSLSITADSYDDGYLEAANAIDERCGL